MSGMYPDNQDIEVFGEQVSWPGVDRSGKFTNGSFNDPMEKPSFIPAETINLILDNLESIVRKCGRTPNAISSKQIADLLESKTVANSIMMRDEYGRAKVAAPADPDDIARLADINRLADNIDRLADNINELAANANGLANGGTGTEGQANILPSHGDSYEGRNLFDVLHVGSLPELALKLEERADGVSKKPNFSGLMIGDYVDGMDLVSGTLDVKWNDTYKNNRIVLSGFNQYKGLGNSEVKRNHFLFTFRDCPVTKEWGNDTDAYVNTQIAKFLEIDFKNALVAAFGGDFFLPVERCLKKISNSSYWLATKIFLPTLFEATGCQDFQQDSVNEAGAGQFPIFQKYSEQLRKRHNGARTSYWLGTPHPGHYNYFYCVESSGLIHFNTALTASGCAPAFCLASRYD